jgi:hypothetical protein
MIVKDMRVLELSGQLISGYLSIPPAASIYHDHQTEIRVNTTQRLVYFDTPSSGLHEAVT